MRRKTKAEINEEREDRDLRYKELNRSYAKVFGSEEGKRVLNDILSKGYFYTTTFTGDNTGMWLEGKRDLALYVMKRVNTSDSNIVIDIMTDNQKMKLERDGK